MSYDIVTVSNRRPSEWYYLYDAFFASLKGHRVNVLGTYPGQYTGLSDKPRLLYHAINSNQLTSEYLLFVDSWDLVFASSPDEVIEKFVGTGSDIVVSAEKNCFPDDLKKAYDNLDFTSSYKYLNSGVIVGKTNSILELLKSMDAANLPTDYYDEEQGKNIHFNDQFEYQKEFLKQPVKMSLDYSQNISQSMHDVEEGELDFSGERVRNIETNTNPSIIHMNGGSKDKWARTPILKHLGL